MAGIFATAGTRVYIGQPLAAKSTDFVLADFSGQSWVSISWIESMGAFGDEAAEILFESIDATRTQKLTGTRNAGNMEIVCGLDYGDDGQAALRAAEREVHDYGIKVEFDDAPEGGTPSERYFIAKVMSVRERLETANSVVRLAATLGINSNIVVVDAAP